MATKAEIEVEIEVAKKALNKLEKDLAKAGGDGGKKAGKSFSKGFGSALTGGAALLTAATFAIKKFTDAAIVQDDAVNKLNASLQQSGSFTEATSRSLQDFAKELSSVTRFADETIISQLSFAQAMGAGAEQSKTVLKASTDLAAALNIDLNAAVRNVAKTLGGYAGELGEVIPELKNFSQEQLQAGAGVDLLAAKFAGFAEKDASSFGGSIKQVSNAFGDLLEELGAVVTKSGGATGFVNDFKEGLKGLALLVRDIRLRLIDPKSLTDISDAQQKIENLKVRILESEQEIKESNGIFAAFWDPQNNVAKKNLAEMNEELEVTQEKLIQLQEVSEEGKSPLAGTVKKVNKDRKKIEDAMKATAKTINDTINQLLARTISQGIQSLTASLFLGEQGFKNFGATVAGIAGEMAIQLGQTLIATGIGIEALKSLGGAAAIAAGIGLIALGTILKSFSGGEGGASAPSGGGFSGGSSSGGGFSDGGFDPEVTAQQETSGAPTAITVNVEGNILDSEATGLALVDILNDAFDQQGVVVTGNV